MSALANRPGSLRRIETQLDFILLDGSSSMSAAWNQSCAAIEAYVCGLKAENVNSQIILDLFDTTPEHIVVDCPIAEWQSLHTHPISIPHGGTALYDAITLMGRRLRDLDPPRAALTIVTDGDSFDDKFTNQTQARAILDWCRAKGWQVTFIGAGFDNSTQARALGSPDGGMIGVSPARLLEVTSALAKKRKRYGLDGTDMHYTDGEREQFGGYLPPPKAE